MFANIFLGFTLHKKNLVDILRRSTVRSNLIPASYRREVFHSWMRTGPKSFFCNHYETWAMTRLFWRKRLHWSANWWVGTEAILKTPVMDMSDLEERLVPEDRVDDLGHRVPAGCSIALHPCMIDLPVQRAWTLLKDDLYNCHKKQIYNSWFTNL